jgi:hypothetical protein
MDDRLQIGIAHRSRGVMFHSFNVPTRHFMSLQRFMRCSQTLRELRHANHENDRGEYNGPAHGRVR